MVDLIGIEPMTSSMPWKRAPKLRHRPTHCWQCNFPIVSAAAGFRQTRLYDRQSAWNPTPVEPSNSATSARSLQKDKKFLRDREHWRQLRCLRQ